MIAASSRCVPQRIDFAHLVEMTFIACFIQWTNAPSCCPPLRRLGGLPFLGFLASIWPPADDERSNRIAIQMYSLPQE